MMAAPPPLTWVILARAARRTKDEDVVSQHGGMRIELARTPAISSLTLPMDHVFSHHGVDPTVEEGRYFVVVAADGDAGLLIASSSNPCLAPLDRAPLGTTLDVFTEDSTLIPVPTSFPRLLGSLGRLGLTGLPCRDGCLVAELQHAAGSATAALIVFRSDDDERRWVETELPVPEAARGWVGGDGVFAHDGALYWVDLCRGMLSCNPLVEQPALFFHGLPRRNTDDTSDAAAGHAVRATRCLNASSGRLRFAEVHRDGGAPALAVWTLGDDGNWRMEASLALSQLWGRTEIDAFLVPQVLLVHPRAPDVIYLLLQGRIFAVDVQMNKLLEMENSPCTSWRDIVLWELPAFVSPDRYPRCSGSLALPGWDMLHLSHASPRHLIVSAQPAGSQTVLVFMMWTSFKFSELFVKMEQNSSNGEECKVRVKVLATDRLITETLPLSSCLIVVPVPDFACIFRALGVTMGEMRKAPCEPTVLTGRLVWRGCYSGGHGGWKVDFVEQTTPSGPVLLMKFHSPAFYSFDALMVSPWPRFRFLWIRQRPAGARTTCDVRFKDSRSAREWLVRDVTAAVRMVPIPLLSYIKDALVPL